MLYILTALLITSISVNTYQYTQNFDFTSQKTDMTVQLATTTTRLEMNRILTQVQTQVNAELNQIDDSILLACEKLSTMDLMGSEARMVMDEIAASNPFIVNAATADSNDTLLVVAPGEYSSIEAINICYQEQNIKMHAEMRPAMSNMIFLVEGFYGVVMEAPIFDDSDTFIGSLSIVIQPSEIMAANILPALQGTPYRMWVMQINGTLLYDPDPVQQGKNLFTAPMYTDYPSVHTFVRQVADAPAGYSSYQYHQHTVAGELVNKEAYWATVGIYGAEWRVIITYTFDT